MNTYNEDLRKEIVSSLNGIESDLGKTNAKKNAAMFTLYYAEGTKNTANIKTHDVQKRWVELNSISSEAVKNKNVAANLLTTATKEKEFVTEAKTNVSVAAVNIQTAANAVLKLASDVGSVFSIVAAADYGTDIFTQAQYAKELIDDTAYNAELASQKSMIATSLTASVSADNVAEKATITNTAVAALSDVLVANLKATHEEMEAIGTALGSASEIEKNAEGQFEDLVAEYMSTLESYRSNQKELNLNLQVKVNENYLPKSDTTSLSDDAFEVSFNPFYSPFGEPGKAKSDSDADAKFQPVENYFVFVVEGSKKNDFTLSIAEDILSENPEAGHKISPIIGGKNPYKKVFKLKDKDASGKPIEAGKDYVIFVLAELSTSYKKRINNFDDYLSAASSSYKLTTKLAPAIDFSINGNTISFKVDERIPNVEYRCMFLAASTTPITKILTVADLKNRREVFESMAKINESVEISILENAIIHIGKINKNIQSRQAKIKKIELKLEELNREKSKYKKYIKDLLADIKKENEFIKKDKEEIKKIKEELSDLGEYLELLNKSEIYNETHSAINFLFNKTIAQQVTSGSYSRSSNDLKCEINNDTTDNFGRRLVAGVSYIPVVLSYSTAGVETIGQYENTLSDFEHTGLRVRYPAE